MNRPFLFALALPLLATLLSARSFQESNALPDITDVEATIQAELESHGERVIGREAYRWSTRLQGISDCRATIWERTVNNVGAPTIRTQTYDFSLASLEPGGIDVQKHWVKLSCTASRKCIFSVSNCLTKSKEGIVIDCSTASQNLLDSVSLEFDGDAASAVRLERAFRDGIDICRTRPTVNF